MKVFDTVILKQQELLDRGVNLDAMGITNRKNRPYVIIAQNRQMTWLAPLTTVLKGKHGRVQVTHVVRDGFVDCEVITTDMFSLSTNIVASVGVYRGKIAMHARDNIIDQLKYSISCGVLGRAVA